MGCLMVYGRGDVFSSANHFNQQQELTALLFGRVEFGRGGIVRIQWTSGGTACLGVNAGS